MKPSVADTREFRNWLRNQKKKEEYDYKATAFNRIKAIEKNKKFFKAASFLLLAAIGILLMISFVL